MKQKERRWKKREKNCELRGRPPYLGVIIPLPPINALPSFPWATVLVAEDVHPSTCREYLFRLLLCGRELTLASFGHLSILYPSQKIESLNTCWMMSDVQLRYCGYSLCQNIRKGFTWFACLAAVVGQLDALLVWYGNELTSDHFSIFHINDQA